jgi:hypothetical protein
MRVGGRGVLGVAVVVAGVLGRLDAAGTALAQEPPPAPPGGQGVQTPPGGQEQVPPLAPVGQGPPESMEPLPREQISMPLTQGPVMVPVRVRVPEGWAPPSRYGAAITAGAGAGGFVDDAISGRTGIGASWGLRVAWGTRTPLAFEATYLGSANDVTGTGTGSDAFLLRSTFEGALRFNAPILRGWTLLEPFGLVGVGWTRYGLFEGDEPPGPGGQVDDTVDDQLTVPLGAGIAYGMGWFTADVRFTYRFALDDDMFGASDMSAWNASLGLGIEF